MTKFNPFNCQNCLESRRRRPLSDSNLPQGAPSLTHRPVGAYPKTIPRRVTNRTQSDLSGSNGREQTVGLHIPSKCHGRAAHAFRSRVAYIVDL